MILKVIINNFIAIFILFGSCHLVGLLIIRRYCIAPIRTKFFERKKKLTIETPLNLLLFHNFIISLRQTKVVKLKKKKIMENCECDEIKSRQWYVDCVNQ